MHKPAPHNKGRAETPKLSMPRRRNPVLKDWPEGAPRHGHCGYPRDAERRRGDGGPSQMPVLPPLMCPGGCSHTQASWNSASLPLIPQSGKDTITGITLNLTQLIYVKEIFYKLQYLISDKVACDHSRSKHAAMQQ